jgi:hypothetical protein
MFLNKTLLLLVFLSYSAFYSSYSQNRTDTTLPEHLLDNMHVSGQWFLTYKTQQQPVSDNLFTLKRGYLTFKENFTDMLSIRFTQDITLDKEGTDMGNIEMRLKYCHLKIKPQNIALLSHSYIEIGLVHRPWLGFEEKINHYRVQGTMFLERVDLYNSADFGATFVSLLGGEINKDFQNKTGTKQIGKYGSLAVGVYNGAGYHAIEKNKNKTIEARLTLRPLHKLFPGLKISYNGAYGKGNSTQNPAFQLNSFFASHESRYSTITGHYYFGKGNSFGTFADSTGNAYKNSASSAFIELKHPSTNFTLFGRYDHFLSEQETDYVTERWIGGIAYYFYKRSKIILDTDYFNQNGQTHHFYEAAIEIKF